MKVHDRYLSIIPRSHYKWAGIQKVEPIYRVNFMPINREKILSEYAVLVSGSHKKCDDELPKKNVQSMSYDKRGKIIECHATGSMAIYC